MNERVMQFRVGVVVAVTLLIGTVLFVLFARPLGMFEDRFSIYVDTPQAPGVTIDTPVRKNGILVGRVTDVQLTESGARMTLAIQTKYQPKLRRNEICRIGGGSILGDAVVNFVPSGDPRLPNEPIQEGDVLRGMVRRDPFQVIGNIDEGLDRVFGSVTAASNEVATLARGLGGFVKDNDAQFNAVLKNSAATLESIQSIAVNLEGVVNDPKLRDNLRNSLQEMPALLREAREATTYVKRTLANADASFVSMRRITQPLAENGEGLVERADELFRKLNRSADTMEELLENLLLFSQALRNRNGTLGKLLYDSELHDSLVDTTSNINRLSIELRPVLYNARLLTDKLSRHPEKLGVRGALERGSGGSKPVRPVYPR